MAQTKEGAIKIAAKKAGLSVSEYVNLITSGMKKCTICKEWKKIECFGKNRSKGDKRSPSCKPCSKAMWRLPLIQGSKRIVRRDGDRKQARHRINADIERGYRPNPNDLFCSLCGHKGQDKRHEYHHVMGYGKDHHNDVLPLCSTCHHREEQKNAN